MLKSYVHVYFDGQFADQVLTVGGKDIDVPDGATSVHLEFQLVGSRGLPLRMKSNAVPLLDEPYQVVGGRGIRDMKPYQLVTGLAAVMLVATWFTGMWFFPQIDEAFQGGFAMLLLSALIFALVLLLGVPMIGVRVEKGPT